MLFENNFVPLRQKTRKENKIMEQLMCFEVNTIYKSGRKKNEIIVSKNEESMWKYYDKHHNPSKIDSTTIYDVWVA